MTPERKENVDQFIRSLIAKMEKGETEHGRTVHDEVKEIKDELLDICGWAFVRYERLQNLLKVEKALTDRGMAFSSVAPDNQERAKTKNVIM